MDLIESLLGKTAGIRWEQLGDVYYRKTPLFRIQWPFNVPSLQQDSFTLDGLLIVCAPNGGPIAMTPATEKDPQDTSRISEIPAKDFLMKLRIFTNSGTLISEIPWPHTNVKAIGWTYNECLAAITAEGTVFIYNIHGKRLLETNMADHRDFFVSRTKITPYGIVAELLDRKIVFFSFAESRTIQYPELPAGGEIVCIDMILHTRLHDNQLQQYNAQKQGTEQQQQQKRKKKDGRHRADSTDSVSSFQPMAYASHDDDSDDDDYSYQYTGNDGNLPFSISGDATANEKRYLRMPSIVVGVYSPVSQKSSIHILHRHKIQSYTDLVPDRILQMCTDPLSEYIGVLSNADKSSRNPTAYCYTYPLMKLHYSFETQVRRPPLTFAFCGNGNLLFHWNVAANKIVDGVQKSTKSGAIYIRGLHRSYISYSWVGSPIIIAPEVDGIRIITESQCEYCQLVPTPIQETLQPDADHPATRLLTSSVLFKQGQVEANTIIRELIVKDELIHAVETLLRAACLELHPATQNLLLTAVSYGRIYLKADEDISPDDFVDSCKLIRLLNNLRQFEVGSVLTYLQLQCYFSLSQVINRLVAQHRHFLAFKICEALRMSPEVVILDWCLTKLLASSGSQPMSSIQQYGASSSSDTSDVSSLLFSSGSSSSASSSGASALVRAMLSKLSLCRGLSYAKVALCAARYAQSDVAIALAMAEPYIANKVGLLIALNQYQTAITVAFESNIYELLIMTVLRLRDTIEHGTQFVALLRGSPEAEQVYLQYCLAVDYEMFINYTSLAGLTYPRVVYSSLVSSNQLQQKDDDYGHSYNKGDPLEVIEEFNQFKQTTTVDRVCQPTQLPSVIADHHSLLSMQRKWAMNQEFPLSDIGISLVDTIFYFYRHDESKVPLLRDIFKISEKRLAYLEIRVLVENKKWAALQSKSNRFSLTMGGYDYIIEICSQYNAIDEAKKYISLLPQYEDQLEWYCALNLFSIAANVAFNRKDLDALYNIRSRCKEASTRTAIDGFIKNLS